MRQKVDFSYKKNARDAYYDIEVLHDIFTSLFMTKGYVDLWVVTDEYYDHITNEQIADAMHDFLHDDDVVKLLGEPEFRLFRFKQSDSHTDLLRLLGRFINCQTLWLDKDRNQFTNFYGWNSARYDLPMLAAANSIVSTNKKLNPSILKRASDNLINFDGPPWKSLAALTDGLSPILELGALKNKLNVASWRDGHIDVAKILKSTDDGSESRFPPGLKKEMARFGLDIVIDEAVSGPNKRLTDNEFLELIKYNGNDVLGTMLTSRNDVAAFGLSTRDTIRQMFPYTSARSTPFDKITKYTSPERDATAANIAGLVLIGPDRSKPVDYEAVSYLFPLANGTKVDLLDYMRDHEDYMHPYLYQFFDHFRGKDTRRSYDDWKVKKAQPITHNATLNVPYYRDGKPIDAYIRVSTGGAHGSVMAGLSQKTEVEILEWIKSDIGAQDSEKPTVDLTNVVHADWSSFYPVLASKLQLYTTSEGIDRYTGIIEHRIRIKEALPHLKAEWTDEHYAMQEEQNGLKFILNNATGAGNMHQKYALLPLDNKTLSMRLIGNLHIWCLAQRFVQAGAYIVSTNTDGIYVTGIDIDKADEIIKGYVDIYGMGVEPEIVDRFINRDTSNRVEYQGDKRTSVRGRLRHGDEMTFADASIGNNIPYPLVAARAALDYMNQPDWLETPYDRAKLEAIVRDLFTNSTDPQAWYHVYVGSGKRALTVNGERMGRINRVVLTVEGDNLGLESVRDLTKAEISSLILADDPYEQLSTLGYETYIDVTRADEIIAYQKQTENKEEILVPNASFDIARRMKQPAALHGKLAIRRDGEIIPLQVWKTGSLTGYTSNTGKILNTRKSLHDFDMSTLDLKAYVDWAESLLEGWKVTADIPEIGLYSIDDTVTKKTKKSRVTKKDKAIELLNSVYQSALNFVQD